MQILVAGSGKLANALLTSDMAISSCEIAKWETSSGLLNERAIVVHAGSGRQLNDCMEFCSRTKSVLIELSTGLGTEKLVPGFPLVLCPNTSVLVLKTLKMLRAYGHCFENFDIAITESHQTAKKTEPGTAYAFAEALKFPTNRIQSVRDPEFQQERLQIPAEYLHKHAYHKIVFRDGNDEVTVETRVLGHQSYARGVKRIVEAVLHRNLDSRLYTIFDMVDNGWL